MKPIPIATALRYMNAGHAFVLSELSALRQIVEREHDPATWRGYVTCHTQLNAWGLLAGPGKGLTEQGLKVLTAYNARKAKKVSSNV